MRSRLFVPASRPDRFVTALSAGADAICIDLEDSVLAEARERARMSLVEFLDDETWPGTSVVTVRVNPVGSADFTLDIAAAVHGDVSAIVLTKVSSAEQVQRAAEEIATLEKQRGFREPIALLPTIESPAGLRNANEIAAASPRVSGLQLGFADLLLPLGISADYPAARDYARWDLRLAAGEAGVECYEAAYLNFRDVEGFRAELGQARALGFAGASCIHPSQVAIANEVFTPTPEELEQARAVIRAAEAASAQGASATADGRLVDAPVIEAARKLLRRSQMRE